MSHTLFCPRDDAEIKTESEFRSHLFCFFCREKMAKTEWLFRNVQAIEMNWPGVLDKLSGEMEGGAAEMQGRKIKQLKDDIDLYLRTGSTGDKKKDSLIKEIIRRSKSESNRVSGEDRHDQ